MDRLTEFQTKTDRIRVLIDAKHLGGVLLSRRSNFAWLTGGGQNYVVAASDSGVGSLLVTGEKVYVFANNIENHRLVEEELDDLPIEPVAYPWEAEKTEKHKALEKILGGEPLAADGPGGVLDVSVEIMRARHPLLPAEIERYRALGRKAEGVLNRTCQELQPGMSEFQVAGMLAGGCLDAHIDATVRLVAFDVRIDKYRHPIPTKNQLEARAMVVLGARSHGLIASLTRMVNLKPVDADLRSRHDAVCRVDAVLNLASEPGVSLGEVFRKGVAQYNSEGFPEEWRLHHQGGSTGYEGRDTKATPDEIEKIVAPTAVAWNPSIRGTKSEDTFLVTENGIENLTKSEDWPQVRSETELGTLDRCDILER